jgi:hypothetical protein
MSQRAADLRVSMPRRVELAKQQRQNRRPPEKRVNEKAVTAVKVIDAPLALMRARTLSPRKCTEIRHAHTVTRGRFFPRQNARDQWLANSANPLRPIFSRVRCIAWFGASRIQ